MACGCSDEEIFLLDRLPAVDSTCAGRPTRRAPWRTVCGSCTRSAASAAGSASAQLVARVISEAKLVEVALTLPRGEQAAANLLKLADEARAFAGAGGGGLRAFVQLARRAG